MATHWSKCLQALTFKFEQMVLAKVAIQCHVQVVTWSIWFVACSRERIHAQLSQLDIDHTWMWMWCWAADILEKTWRSFLLNLPNVACRHLDDITRAELQKCFSETSSMTINIKPQLFAKESERNLKFSQKKHTSCSSWQRKSNVLWQEYFS